MTIDRNHNVVFENRVDYPYWQGLREGEVRVQRCDKCKNWIWPAEWRCMDCGSWDLHWEAVDAKGSTVYAWTRTHQPFSKNFKDLLPFTQVLVELPMAGNNRMVGLLIGGDEGVKIGAKLIPDIQAPSKRTYDLPALWWRLDRGR